MYTVSDAFNAALLKSHTVVSKVELWSPTAGYIQDLKVASASVSIDRTAKVRRTCSVALADESLIPTNVSSPMWPAGNEMRLYRGIRLVTGDELVPLGVFRVSKPNLDDDGTVQFKVDGYDRAKTVSIARFTAPYVIAAGTRYDTAIKALIQSRVPWMTDAMFNLAPITTVTPLIVFAAQSDPWDAALELAEAVGCDLFFDNVGNLVLKLEADPTTSPVVATYNEGALNTLIKAGRAIDSDNVYNGFVVNGESTGNTVPIYSEKWDDDPSSPTYYLGPYGKVPEFYTSSMITTQTQADAAALAMFYRRRGFGELVEFDAITNPAFDAGDVVQVKRARSGISITGVAESVKIPLDPESDMHVALRRRGIVQ